jgi:hypothetical protein
VQARLETEQPVCQGQDGDQTVPEDPVAEPTDDGKGTPNPPAASAPTPCAAKRDLDLIEML